MITKEEYLILFRKYQQGECTPEEIGLLESFKDDITLPDAEWERSLGNEQEIYGSIKQRLDAHIRAERQEVAVKRSSIIRRSVIWSAAAAVIVVTVSAALWMKGKQPELRRQPVAINRTDSVQPIAPGGDKAYLTMANGAIVDLNDAGNGDITVLNGVQVRKLKDGVIVYRMVDDAGKTTAALAQAYNSITTPRGGQYQVILSDGTKVWLNAASVLKYPAAFPAKERTVELSGEAYFEVARNSKSPFKVQVKGTTVHVLGTHFNINAYNDEKHVKTTLLEGSVKLTSKKSEVLLKPGEQGIVSASSADFDVERVDLDEVVAWKNGFFVFNNEDIHSIMKRISRWYDVDVEFADDFRNKNFGGTVSRFNDVSLVLRALELTGSVHFKMEGRKIIVMP
ncbi:FecR family protein [Filimonas effusa]|uniref:FecR family protein n=1 Tax=Filimonas effusa TaxID=2508721 RepID=A0A4Q1D6V1_9BACT|nr:FecR family protein [Filimonas effusa]RXK83397.1 FecR family protein [Filimonas effusa]